MLSPVVRIKVRMSALLPDTRHCPGSPYRWCGNEIGHQDTRLMLENLSYFSTLVTNSQKWKIVTSLTAVQKCMRYGDDHHKGYTWAASKQFIKAHIVKRTCVDFNDFWIQINLPFNSIFNELLEALSYSERYKALLWERDTQKSLVGVTEYKWKLQQVFDYVCGSV